MSLSTGFAISRSNRDGWTGRHVVDGCLWSLAEFSLLLMMSGGQSRIESHASDVWDRQAGSPHAKLVVDYRVGDYILTVPEP